MTRCRALTLLCLPLLAAGCSIPSWVPLIGRDRPAPGALEPAAPPVHAPAPILSRPAEPPPGDEVLDRVITVVNSDAITLYELDEAEAAYLYETKQRPPAGEARDELRRRLLDTLIEKRIQLQQAEREKIVIEDAELGEALGEVMKRVNAATPRQFEDTLRAEGLTLDGFKKRLREQLMVQRVIRRKVGLRVSVTEQEIDRYLAENRDKLETGLTFHARHILLAPRPPTEEGWQAARQRAQEVYAMLLAGQDFAELARKYSQDPSGRDGGSLGALKRGELAPEIEQAILGLRPGEASTPVRSQVGYHVFRLDAKETLAGEALVQARNQIREILYRQKYEARLKEWLAELRERAVIDIRL